MMARVLALLALFHSAAAEASCVHVQNHAYGKECAAWADGMYYKTTEMQDGKPIWQRGHGHVPEWGDMVRRPLPARRACAAPSRLQPGARPTAAVTAAPSGAAPRGAADAQADRSRLPQENKVRLAYHADDNNWWIEKNEEFGGARTAFALASSSAFAHR